MPPAIPAGMHRNVEILLGRLATDGELERRFAAGPRALLSELRDAGLELTAIELEAVARTSPEALRAFALSLDRRLRKAPPAVAEASPTHRSKDLETP